MEKKMTVKEFVEKYKKLKSDNTRKGLLESIKFEEYISYERKADLCKVLVKNTFEKKEKDINGNEVVKFNKDSVAEYMMYNLMLINEYTNILVDYKNNVEEFNLLNEPLIIVNDENGNEIKIGMFDALLSKISSKELKEFRMILDFTESDLIQNKYENHAFITEQVSRITDVMSGILTSFEPVIKQLNNKIENMDEKEVKGFTNKVSEMINKLK